MTRDSDRKTADGEPESDALRKPGLWPFSKKTERLFDVDAWRFFYRYYRAKRWRLLLYAILTSLQSLLVVPIIYLIRYIFDHAIPQGNVRLLFVFGAAILLLQVVVSLVKLGIRAYVLRIVKDATHRMRRDLIGNLYKISRAFYTRTRQDRIHTQIVQDTQRVDVMSNALLSTIMPAAITAIALAVILLAMNWVLVVAGMAIFPVLWWATGLTGRYVKRAVFLFQRAFETFSGGVNFVLRNIDLTRERAYEDEEVKRQTHHIRDLRDKSVRMAMSHAIHSEVHKNITGLGGLIILVFGGAAIVAGTMTLGEFVSFYVAAGFINGAISQIVAGIPHVITGNESLVTLTKLFDGAYRVPYGGGKRLDFNGNLEVRNVEFQYGEKPVLRDVSLTIRPGSNIAIVGANGAGKTTLMNLILGFYKPSSGLLLADSVPYAELDLRDLRRKIGMVPQQPAFFSGSVLENVIYGVPDATHEQVSEAAQLALADEVIQSWAKKYDTEMGDEGVCLSGGERQRLAIIRALLGRPRLLILDEPTNHLDASAVVRLMAGMMAWKERPSVITISHDPHVVGYADEIYLLNDGYLREQAPPSSATRVS